MTSSASALGSVLAAEGSGGDGFQPPTIAEFYAEPIAEFSLLGIDFAITRITIANEPRCRKMFTRKRDRSGSEYERSQAPSAFNVRSACAL